MVWAPGLEVAAAGTVIDMCHAASMFALAAADQRLRRAAIADALAATTLAAAAPAAAVLAGEGQS
jgi:hypothetical protein